LGEHGPVLLAERVVLAGQAWVNGWASKSEPEICIFELNWVVF